MRSGHLLGSRRSHLQPVRARNDLDSRSDGVQRLSARELLSRTRQRHVHRVSHWQRTVELRSDQLCALRWRNVHVGDGRDDVLHLRRRLVLGDERSEQLCAVSARSGVGSRQHLVHDVFARLLLGFVGVGRLLRVSARVLLGDAGGDGL